MKYPLINETIEPQTLYVVATPIGNLNDITLRALYILDNVDAILCEDTRRTAPLLKHYDINKPLISFHSHSDEKKYNEIKERLKSQTLALVSDAGSPCISDPGAELAAELIKAGFIVRPIPGPSAAITALTASGLDTREFTFRGFLGKKGLKAKVEAIMELEEIQVVYEAPGRLLELLALIKDIDSKRLVVVTRELTKLYEEFFRGTVTECYEYFRAKPVKGEITLLISGKEQCAGYSEEEIARLVTDALNSGESLSRVAKDLAKDLGIPKNTVYDIGLKINR